MDLIAPLEIGIVCRDLPRLRRFYEDALGLAFVSELQVGADKAAASALSSQAYTVVRLQASSGERIKLLQAQGAATESAQGPHAGQGLPRHILDRSGLAYLTFIVEDIDAAIDRLSAAGVEWMTGTERVEVRPGVYLAFCRDPEGNVLELVQYHDIAEYRSDLAQKEH